MKACGAKRRRDADFGAIVTKGDLKGKILEVIVKQVQTSITNYKPSLKRERTHSDWLTRDLQSTRRAKSQTY